MLSINSFTLLSQMLANSGASWKVSHKHLYITSNPNNSVQYYMTCSSLISILHVWPVSLQSTMLNQQQLLESLKIRNDLSPPSPQTAWLMAAAMSQLRYNQLQASTYRDFVKLTSNSQSKVQNEQEPSGLLKFGVSQILGHNKDKTTSDDNKGKCSMLLKIA